MRISALLLASLVLLAHFPAFAQKKEEKKKPDEKATPSNSAMVIGDTELKPGKKVVITMDIDASGLKSFSTVKGGPTYTKLKFAVALPENFNPQTKYPMVVVCSTDSGNATPLTCIDPFVSAGTKAGYIVIAAEPVGVQPSNDNATVVYFMSFNSARRALVEKFPALLTSPVVPAGHSGGGKRAGLFAAIMEGSNYTVMGVFMSGVNFDTLSLAKSPAKLRKTPIFVSNGAKDSYVPAAANKEVLDSLKKGGFRNVKSPGHPGAHVIVQDHVKEALEWFKVEAL